MQNGIIQSEDYILMKEVFKGEMIFCRDVDLHAALFSWTLRLYEDQMFQIRNTVAC